MTFPRFEADKSIIPGRRFGTPEEEKGGGGAGGSNYRRVSPRDAALEHILC